MIKIKIKLLIIVMAVVLFVNSYDLRVFANSNYNHNELLEYEGYAEVMYESIVEQTTFISGRYTENKDYVNESINEISDYARGWWNEYMRISEMPPKEKIREMVNAGGGYLLTVGDFIKNLFTDKESNEAPPTDFLDYDSVYGKCFTWDNLSLSFKWGTDCAGTVKRPDGQVIPFSMYQSTFNVLAGDGAIYVTFGNSPNYWHPERYKDYVETVKARDRFSGSFNGMYSAVLKAGFIIDIQFKKQPIQPPTFNPRPITNITNYIKDNPIQVQTPQPIAYLSCPDGTRINMKINGGTFLDVKGNIMSVDKNGTATIDSQICNLGWEKPKIGYIDGTDQVGISTPDKDIVDAETGEIISGGFDDGFDDEIKDGCGTICAIGKLLSGLGSLVKAVAAIPLKILDGLFELIKKVVVPPENYLTEQMDTIKGQFFNEEIEEGIQSIEQLSSAGGGTFESVQVSIMGVDNVMVVDSSSVNKSLDTIHSWIRGVFYPLLLFFNINMLYRLIRGTSLVGIGKIDFSPKGDKK